ncbi:MAG TPA: methyltransferase domain-containing protein [Bryobacteraceae bacterium]|jgi:SAM-dependent methyltransferase
MEFTGERVIPGQVNDDLWSEHISRYAYAARFASGARALDAGCGTGYGSVELARHGWNVTAFDIAPDAMAFAREHLTAPNLHYVRASATSMPFAEKSFDLVTAFEVIEHLEDWRGLLREARRVLAPGGVFLVSTPNRVYYAEARAKTGPNPFHVHEFDYEEFRESLEEFFPHVRILFQNRLEAFAFHGEYPEQPAEVRFGLSRSRAAGAHFFLALCGAEAPPVAGDFVYVPRAANLLREREQHIRLLEGELEQNKGWLQESIGSLETLQRNHEALTGELERQNRWALELDSQVKSGLARVAEVQGELAAEQGKAAAVVAAYDRKVVELEEESRSRAEWALETERRLGAELSKKTQEQAATVKLLDAAEGNVVERTLLAQRLAAEVALLRSQMEMVQQSRWLRLGRVAGLGPKL